MASPCDPDRGSKTNNLKPQCEPGYQQKVTNTEGHQTHTQDENREKHAPTYYELTNCNRQADDMGAGYQGLEKDTEYSNTAHLYNELA